MKNIINYEGKYVGHVEGNVFYTERKTDHIFNLFHSFNISKSVLNEAKQYGATSVLFSIKDNDKIERKTISIKEIEKCRTYDHNEDLQWVIPLKDLRYIEKCPQTSLFEDFKEIGDASC